MLLKLYETQVILLGGTLLGRCFWGMARTETRGPAPFDYALLGLLFLELLGTALVVVWGH